MGGSKSGRRERSRERDKRKDKDRDRERRRSRSRSRSRKRNRSEDRSHRRKDKDKDRKKKRDSSSSSSSSSGGGGEEVEVKLLKKLQDKRAELLLTKKKEKEQLKAKETPEEKRIRRLLKKEAKEKKRKERMGWDSDYLHYTNTDNPFGDANLLSTFMWGKKLSKEGLGGLSREEVERRNRLKQEENRAELEKVKRRRQEREAERLEREAALAALQRDREAEQFQVWEHQEDQFHLEQARLRSTIRINDGRAKPIDLLAKYIHSEEEVDAVEMHEPYTYLNGLSIPDLEDLIEDIKVYMKLERGANLDYWTDMTVIVEDELAKLRKGEARTEYELAVGRREGIHESVAKEVAGVLRNKTASQLAQLQAQVESKMKTAKEEGGAGIHIGYWECLLSQLKAHMARARLRDRHQSNLKTKLRLLKAQQGVQEQEEPSEDSNSCPARPSTSQEPEPSTSTSQPLSGGEEEEDEGEGEEDEPEAAGQAMLTDSLSEYSKGCYSPVYLSQQDLEPGTLVTDQEDDEHRLEFARLRILGLATLQTEAEDQAQAALVREARKGMGGDEAMFSVESLLDPQVYLWSDKYRPRKPRYFNRVHTGFEWNKYNQTHYDMDNPPPKIVQGYKFNIFYPDLIDKSFTPQYFLTACPDNTDFAVLRFHAGPPYEDIAFKIVNREWEYSYKRGFRCQFHNNIFQLWFHFKRYRYRR